jgi:hypothetical protein
VYLKNAFGDRLKGETAYIEDIHCPQDNSKVKPQAAFSELFLSGGHGVHPYGHRGMIWLESSRRREYCSFTKSAKASPSHRLSSFIYLHEDHAPPIYPSSQTTPGHATSPCLISLGAPLSYSLPACPSPPYPLAGYGTTSTSHPR